MPVSSTLWAVRCVSKCIPWEDEHPTVSPLLLVIYLMPALPCLSWFSLLDNHTAQLRGTRGGSEKIPSLTSHETLLHIPWEWWGCLSLVPRRQKTSQFADFEEHNIQHSGFHTSVQHSSPHCRHAEHTIWREGKLATSASWGFLDRLQERFFFSFLTADFEQIHILKIKPWRCWRHIAQFRESFPNSYKAWW